MATSIKKRWGLTVSSILFVFAVMATTMTLTGLVVVALYVAGAIPPFEGVRPEHDDFGWGLRVILMMVSSSIFFGTLIAGFFSTIALKPIRQVIAATHRIAEGDFSVRVNLRGIYELEELSGSFNKMAGDLASIETLRSDFVNNFSHEFKTPIVSIRGFAKLLKKGQLTEAEQQEYLDIIIGESQRLAQLSSNILDLSKYENTGIVTDKTTFRLDEQVRRTVVVTEPQWAAKGISFNVGMDEVVFRGNEDLTQQIWLNLIDNAVKFSNPGGVVNLRLARHGGDVEFSIQDFGIGMDGPTKDKVFDRFYQGNASHADVGNGLGLTIVKRIVDLCGGRLEVQSEPGEGATFTVRLPG
ncbi:MAG: HAMP domain-containing histidine kinase [Eggerthellaceae bacterium]|nr:HAMP domain-containing histidine kinase [Eggerthellaceae bacterium]